MDISLALGGGGARGIAHIGVIRRLEEEGFRIRAVAGTSAGGIVAAMYSAGYSTREMEDLFSKVDQTKFYGRTPHQHPPSLLGLAGAEKLLEGWLGQRTFNDLKIPCALTAVDLKSAREVNLKQGRVVDAVLATIALPGIFPPSRSDDYLLVDGGVLDPVPVSAARRLAPRLAVIAVVLTPLVRPKSDLTRLPLRVPLPAPLVERITRLRLAQAFNIFLQSVDVGARMITELRLEIDDPDVIVRPLVDGIGLLDKVDVHEIVRLGEQAVDVVLPEITQAVSWTKRMRRRISRRASK